MPSESEWIFAGLYTEKLTSKWLGMRRRDGRMGDIVGAVCEALARDECPDVPRTEREERARLRRIGLPWHIRVYDACRRVCWRQRRDGSRYTVRPENAGIETDREPGPRYRDDPDYIRLAGVSQHTRRSAAGVRLPRD